MRHLFTNFRKVKTEEKKILKTINNVNFKSIPVKFSGRVVREITNILREFDNRTSCITERRFKLILAADLTGTIVDLQWQCVEQTLQNSVYHILHAVLYRQIALRKKKRTALLARRESYFKKLADRKIVNEFNQVFNELPPNEDISKDGDGNISVLRAQGRPSTGYPLEGTGLSRLGSLAPPLMSTSLIPAPREYIDITNNLSVGFPQTSEAVNYTIGEPSAILGIQAPDELPSYIEEVATLPAEQDAPILVIQAPDQLLPYADELSTLAAEQAAPILTIPAADELPILAAEKAAPILGIQAPGELPTVPAEQIAPTMGIRAPTYVEDTTVPAEQAVLMHTLVYETINIKEEPTTTHFDKRNIAGETTVANYVAELPPVEQSAILALNETAFEEHPSAILQNITAFADVTIDEMRLPYMHRTGERGLLADVDEINAANNAINKDQTVIPETPDSDIHQLLEPVILPLVLRKKGKLIIDKQTKILDYSARAVKLTNKPHSNQNLYEKTNFNLKKLKLTMSAARLFKTPACSSMFNPIRGSALTKSYERHLITDDMPIREIERVSYGVPIARDLFANNENAPPRQDNDGISMIRHGNITNLSLSNRVSVNQSNISDLGLQIAQNALNLPQETARESLNIIIADKSIVTEKTQENGQIAEILGDISVAAPVAGKNITTDNDKQSVLQEKSQDAEIVAQKIIADESMLTVPRVKEADVHAPPAFDRNYANDFGKEGDAINSVAAIDKGNLPDNIQPSAQQETTVDKAQNTSVLGHALNLVGVDRNYLTDNVQELLVPLVENVSLNEKVQNNLPEYVTLPQDPLIKKELKEINLIDKEANNIPSVIVQYCPIPVNSELMQQHPCIGEIDPHVLGIPAVNMEQTSLLDKEADNIPSVIVQDCPTPDNPEVMLQQPCVGEAQHQVPDNIPTVSVEPQQEKFSPSKALMDLIKVIPIARLQEDSSALRRGSANEIVANTEPVIPAILESGAEITIRPIFLPRGDLPSKEFRSSQYVMEILTQNWELVNIISITDILGTEHTLNNEVILIKTLLRLNKQWAVQLNKVYDTLAISPFPENVREICMSF